MGVKYQGWWRKKGGQYEQVPGCLGEFREVYNKLMMSRLTMSIDEWDYQAVPEGQRPRNEGKREIRPQYNHRQMRAKK